MWAASNITDHLRCRFDHHRSRLITGRGGAGTRRKGPGMIAIWRAGLRRWLIPGLAVLLAAAWSAVGLPAQPAAAATTITVNGTQGGRTFDGIGAISGGGGNTRLLTDYPAAQQQQ